MTTKIIGTGSYVPERVVSNDDLAKVVETSDEWIQSRTGIRERRIAVCEGTSELAAKAAAAAMENAGIEASEIDIIILATSSPDNCFPNGACEVQAAIGAENAVAFDISAACTGFVYALNTMHAFLKSGLYRTGLVIGADVMSKLTDWTDRGTCVLFGDGAGAAVVRADERGLIDTLVGSDGRKGWVLDCQARSLGNCLTKTKPELGFMQMDGQEVFKFAVRKVPEITKKIMEDRKLRQID
ncbi:MAG: beta-ketoacyl-ACP synthase 3, partial [Hungatella hathewayi]|nr:beta-ketoacyl-ACP synthase 3 [Hungatella hathewayi]